MEQTTLNRKVGEFLTARRTLPLVRSIAREVRDRYRAISVLESQLEGRGSSTHEDARHDVLDLGARLATARRELRLAEKELMRLGWLVERSEPMRLIYHGEEGDADLTWQPEDTGFYRVSTDL